MNHLGVPFSPIEDPGFDRKQVGDGRQGNVDEIRVIVVAVSNRASARAWAADLYLMPAYDPTASEYFEDGQWMIH
jgi:hypothetical protein